MTGSITGGIVGSLDKGDTIQNCVLIPIVLRDRFIIKIKMEVSKIQKV